MRVKYKKIHLLWLFVTILTTCLFYISMTAYALEETTETTESTVAVTNIEFADYESELNVGKSLTLSATVYPTDASVQTVTYKSSNTDIATVSPSGEVKGISAGKVTIYASAGIFTKEINLTVTIATTKISLNSTYVVLKTNKTFALKATVLPANATAQAISYKSLDTSVAAVSDSGIIKGVSCGNTTIMVSNNDTSVAVTVIVNNSQKPDNNTQNISSSNGTEQTEYPSSVTSKNYKTLSKDMLKYLYQNGKKLTVTGEGYSIIIKGEDIVNYDNEFDTNIVFTKGDKGISFILNNGKNLCGPLTLKITDNNIHGKYLYIYNETNKKYNLIETDNIKELKLNTPGKYLITTHKLSNYNVNLIVIICVSVVIIGLFIVYIVIKRNYWFW